MCRSRWNGMWSPTRSRMLRASPGSSPPRGPVRSATRFTARLGLGAYLLRGGHHVLQGRGHLVDVAGLQAAVRIDPKPLGRNGFQCGPQRLGHLLGARYPRRVDVVDTRTDAVGKADRVQV